MTQKDFGKFHRIHRKRENILYDDGERHEKLSWSEILRCFVDQWVWCCDMKMGL